MRGIRADEEVVLVLGGTGSVIVQDGIRGREACTWGLATASGQLFYAFAPALMGAAHDALRASNARVSLSCLHIIAHRLPHLFYGPVLSLSCLAGVPSC